jgi:hypothetical protein
VVAPEARASSSTQALAMRRVTQQVPTVGVARRDPQEPVALPPTNTRPRALHGTRLVVASQAP